MEPLPPGRNSRVYRVECGDAGYVAKFYFRSPEDPRDRLAREADFLRHLNALGVRQVPTLHAIDREAYCALLSYLPGRVIHPSELSERHLEQALDFIALLNQAAASRPAFADASEACFSIDAHLAVVDRRIDAMDATITDPRARDFLTKILTPAWHERRIAATEQAGGRIAELLPSDDRCLSPSDFGFHNALLDTDGRLSFLDFEYSGIDDPAKLFCDFSSHVEVPIPSVHLRPALARLAALARDAPWFQRRCRILLPVYRLKWACIVLGAFMPASAARQAFAGRDVSDGERESRLAAARSLVRRANEEWPG